MAAAVTEFPNILWFLETLISSSFIFMAKKISEFHAHKWCHLGVFFVVLGFGAFFFKMEKVSVEQAEQWHEHPSVAVPV